MPAPKDFEKMWRDLLARITKLEQRQSLAGTGWSVLDPGQVAQDGSVVIPNNGLLLVDGGDVIMLNSTAVEVFRLGIMPGGDRGIQIKRTDGGVAFEVRDVLGFGVQSIAIRDSDGFQIGGTGLFPAGLGAPYIPLSFTPADYTSGALAQSVTAGTFTATHEHYGYKQNNVVKPLFRVKCSDGSTSGEIQLYNVDTAAAMTTQTGAALTITVPTGTTGWTDFYFADHVFLPGAYGSPAHYQIQARRTAGAGTVSVAPVRMIGVRDQLAG